MCVFLTGERDSSKWQYQEQQQDVTSLMEQQEESSGKFCSWMFLYSIV